jgi:hypothetical protein
MSSSNNQIQGRLTLKVRSAENEVLARREGENMVLRKGAGIIAKLFAGIAGSKPINQVQVGFAKEAATAELTALTPPEGNIPVSALRSPLSPDSFQIATDKSASIQVFVTAIFKPGLDLQDVTEAGLLADEELYNQVVFEPVTMRAGQNITFFWEIDFPFGH